MTDLTKQWKKGELKKNKYWVKYKNGKIDTWELSEGITIESKPEIIEVLAPVPSFQEWQKVLNIDFNNEVLRLENQRLNERLLDMIDLLQKCYFYLNAVADGKVKTEHLEQIKTLAVLIDNAIGEKK